jgi:DNA-binding NarL/FixJ family response regulator
VLIVDDEPDVRRLLEVVLGVEDGIDVIGTAGSAEDALVVAEQLVPDLVVLDNRMPGGDGVHIVPTLRARGLRVVMYTADDSPELREAVRQHQAGYVRKSGEISQLVSAILS